MVSESCAVKELSRRDPHGLQIVRGRTRVQLGAHPGKLVTTKYESALNASMQPYLFAHRRRRRRRMSAMGKKRTNDIDGVLDK